VTFLSIALLGGVIWTLRFLVPAAIRTGDRFGLAVAILTAALLLVAWLLLGVPARS
jgi:hypothetical protein